MECLDITPPVQLSEIFGISRINKRPVIKEES